MTQYAIILAMKNIIYIQIYRGKKYYIAEGLNLPVMTQGKTLDEAVKNVQEAIELHLEDESLEKYDLSPSSQIVVNYELPSLVYA